MKRGLATFLVAACGHASPSPSPSPIASAPADAGVVDVSQDEVLAGIQKAMNDLAVDVKHCWAVAATERYDVEGEVVMDISVTDSGAVVGVAKNATNSKTLGSCMVTMLGTYHWPPPLRGQSIQLPFKFSAPDSQSVIDRRMVEMHSQGKVGVEVLLDENNTGNGAVSMFELAIKNGESTGTRVTPRAELWYFLTDAGVMTSKLQPKPPMDPVAAGDMMFVPAGGERDVFADTVDARAVVVAVPGGREGAARAGALPTPIRSGKAKFPTYLYRKDAKTFGPATIFLDDSIIKGTPIAASILQLPAGAHVAEHVHAHETEMLYMLEGSGTLTVAGTAVPVTKTSVIQIPPDTKHSVVVTEAMRALQIYTPAGPEQRFKQK